MANERYDIPAKLKRACKSGSVGLQSFYRNFFVDEMGVLRGEVDLRFLRELGPDESAVAKDLVRRNLARGYTHIIQCAGDLEDQEAIHQLRAMLANAKDLSRRLTIAGALWKINRDPCFPDLLAKMIAADDEALKVAHMDQVLWLGDVRAIRMLIDLLSDPHRFVRSLALSRLNEVEYGRRFLAEDLPRPAEDYVRSLSDSVFMEGMVERLNAWRLANLG